MSSVKFDYTGHSLVPVKKLLKYRQIKILTKRLCIRPFLFTDYARCKLSERERSSIQNKFDEPLFGRFLSSYESFKKKVLHDRERGKNRTHYILGIFERRSGQLVGQLDLYLFNDELKWTNLGYHIQNQFWGMGHAPEACRSLLKYAFKFLNIHRVEILMLAENIASLHVAEKLDMVFEGTRTNFFPGERSGELHIFAMNAFDAKK